MQASSLSHATVLLNEAVAALAVKPSGIYVDGTYGRGGHSAKILSLLGDDGRLIVIDKDPEAIADARRKYESDKRVMVWRGSFRDFPAALQEAGINHGMDGLLLDLGVSSPQLDDARRGFSFMREGELDMRMDPDRGLSAAAWLQQASEKQIADVLWCYGEERFARRIARAIHQRCAEHPLKTTRELAELIAQAVPKREAGKHPATRSFQAIRIQVNQELDDVEECLQHASVHLAPGGRLVVISFHSLEDRIVKHFLRELSSPPRMPKGLPVRTEDVAVRMRLVGKAIRPGNDEVQANSRARSAVMRVAEMKA
ncbi:MAG: 16S rRNA (cytosine(1402)-N(4))-methyltransferase RsmH [Thiolinea sp.]